jgi:oxygen-independent coproporphyrinogen III oxidase
MLSLYIHYPFCRRKCRYCDFVSWPLPGVREATRQVDRYIECLCLEMHLAAAALGVRGRTVRTIYFGGGTPSLMHADALNDILSSIRNLFSVPQDAEVSIESNPGATAAPGSWLAAAREIGVNRLVVGVQSMRNIRLAQLGRIHSRAAALEFYARARETGFRSVGLDLMYGLPGQSLDEWKNDLKEAIGLKPDHMSIYCLEIQPGTPLGEDLAADRIREAPEETQAAMYYAAAEMLESAGLRSYEISNFALSGHECAHNLVYWTGGDYLGLGVSACSYIGGWRYENEREMDAYEEKIDSGVLPRRSGELLSLRRRLRESAVMALRTSAGYEAAPAGTGVERELAADLDKLALEGWLVRTPGGAFRLRPERRFVSDAVFSKIVG